MHIVTLLSSENYSDDQDFNWSSYFDGTILTATRDELTDGDCK
jgi:hypothetical protein